MPQVDPLLRKSRLTRQQALENPAFYQYYIHLLYSYNEATAERYLRVAAGGQFEGEPLYGVSKEDFDAYHEKGVVPSPKSKHPKGKHSVRTPVVHKPTGAYYRSTKDAAKAHGMSASYLSTALSRGQGEHGDFCYAALWAERYQPNDVYDLQYKRAIAS